MNKSRRAALATASRSKKLGDPLRRGIEGERERLERRDERRLTELLVLEPDEEELRELRDNERLRLLLLLRLGLPRLGLFLLGLLLFLRRGLPRVALVGPPERRAAASLLVLRPRLRRDDCRDE